MRESSRARYQHSGTLVAVIERTVTAIPYYQDPISTETGRDFRRMLNTGVRA
jgi:hypothetical protein